MKERPWTKKAEELIPDVIGNKRKLKNIFLWSFTLSF